MGIFSDGIEYGPWDGGIDFSRPALDLEPNLIYTLQDCEVLFSGQVTRRKGFDEYITGAFSGTPAITALGKHRFSAGTERAFTVGGAVFYEDVTGTWTDRTGGQTITAAADNTFVTANCAGTMVLTNGVDAMLKWSAAGGNLALLDVDSRFTTALACTFWDNRAWFGNLSSGEDRAHMSDSTDIETYGANNFYLTDGPVTGILPVKTYLSIHNSDGIWGLFPTGNSDVPYSRQRRAALGTVSERGLVQLPNGSQMFPQLDGIYEWDGATDPQKISQRLDGDRFWNLVDLDRIQQSHAVVYPIKNQVYFSLPIAATVGGSQTNMSQVIVWDYMRRIWCGRYVISRNCSAYFDNIPHMGDYAGLVWKHDTGTNDNAGKISGSFLTASPPVEGLHRKVRWLFARHEFEKESTDYNPSVTQLGSNIVSHTESFNIGDTSDALVTEFTIGSSAIRGQEVADTIDTELWGWAAASQLKYFHHEVDQSFTLRRVVLAHAPGDVTRKTFRGI